MSEATSLYRLYDARGVLLYVGISYTAFRRWREHAQTKDWWPEVASIAVEHLPNRAAAEAAELAAIACEGPLYNIAGRPDSDELEWVSLNLAPLAPSEAVVPGVVLAKKRPHAAVFLLFDLPLVGFGVWSANWSPDAYSAWVAFSMAVSLAMTGLVLCSVWGISVLALTNKLRGRSATAPQPSTTS